MGFVSRPQREPDCVLGPLEFYFIEKLAVAPDIGVATLIDIRDGRVGMMMDDKEWRDLGDGMSFEYFRWLFEKNGLSYTKS